MAAPTCWDPILTSIVWSATLADAFTRGKNFYQQSPDLTAGELYDYAAGLAAEYGWEFGARTAGHLIGHFPHER